MKECVAWPLADGFGAPFLGVTDGVSGCEFFCPHKEECQNEAKNVLIARLKNVLTEAD